VELLDPPSLDAFAAASGKPVRCAERGVVAPFTAPLLFAARLRLGSGQEIEVLVPNPAGREGWFVLPWAAAREALQPSLADHALIEALKPLATDGTELQPAQMRQAARQAAGTGLAGRAARRAACSSCSSPSGAELIGEFADAVNAWLLTCAMDDDRRRAAALATRAADVAASITVLKADNAQRDQAQHDQTQRDQTQRDQALRLAWVMDGWVLLALLWRFTPDESRVAVLRRSMALAPPPAEEMLRWPGCSGLGRMPQSPPLAPQTRFVTPAICEAVLAEWLVNA